MRPVLIELRGRVRSLTVVVGPEGGFSPRELDWARHEGFVSVGLGKRILRTETAAIAAIAILQYELGDLGGRMRRAGVRRQKSE